MSEDMPIGWLEVTLPEVVYFQEGPGLRKFQYRDEGIPFLNIRTLVNECVDKNKCKYLDPIEVNKKYNHFLLDENDIVCSSSGTIGKTAVIKKSDLPLMLNTSVIRFRPHIKDIPTRRFIYYFLKSSLFYDQAINASTGSAQINVGPTHLKKFKFCLPPLSEQTRITAKIDSLLTKVDACKARLDKVPEILKRFRQSVLADATSGKLTEDWRQENKQVETAGKILKKILAEKRDYWEEVQLLKLSAKGKEYKNDKWKDSYKEIPKIDRSSLHELPLEWEWVPWEAVLSHEDGAFRRGPFGSAIKKSFFVESGYKVYEQYCPINDDPNFGRYYITEDKFIELHAFEVKAKDFLISCSGVTLGRITQVPEKYDKGVINQALLRVRINDKIIYDLYFKMMFRSPYFQMKIFDNSTGSAQPNVKGVKELKAIPIPLPPITEQYEVVRQVELLFSVADQLEAKLAATQKRVDNLTASILSKAFKGELVFQDPNDEPAEKLLERIRIERNALALNNNNGGRTQIRKSGRKKKAPEDPEPATVHDSVSTQGKKTAEPRKPTSPQTEKRFDKLDVLKAYRKAIFRQNGITELTLLRLTGQRLGVKRLSQQIREELESYLKTALRRKILYHNDYGYSAGAPTIEYYEDDFLIKVLRSLTRKGWEYPRDYLVDEAANYLGFDKASEAFRERMKSIFRKTLSQRALYRIGTYVGKT